MAEIRIVDLMRRIQPCSPDDTCGSLVARFSADAGLRTIPVVQGNVPIRLVHRERFMAAFAGKYGFSLFNDRRLAEWFHHAAQETLHLISVAEDLSSASSLINELPHHGGEPTLVAVQDGRYCGLVGHADLLTGMLATTRAQAAALVSARDTAYQAVAAQSAFLATMSHEIRTPLTAIIGWSDVLVDSDLDAASHEMARIINESGQGLLGLLNDLIDIAKLEVGRIVLESRQFDLHLCCQDVISLLGITTRTKGLALECHLAPDLPQMVVGDHIRVRQILVNLISNAVKFTDRGRVVVKVEPLEKERIQISVADTGIGIPQEAFSKLFKPFSQIENQDRARHGAGLGLSICRRLVELMGGSITVASIVGQGTIFTATLPMATVQMPDGSAIGPSGGERSMSFFSDVLTGPRIDRIGT